MKKILSFFFTSHSDSVGNAYRISRLKQISNRYQLTIISNVPEFLKDQIPSSTIIKVEINYTNVLEKKEAIKLKTLIKETKYDLIYYFHNDSRVSFYSTVPKICEIHQSHEIIGLGYNTKKYNAIFKNFINKFRTIGLIKGIKNADYNFAVSKQLVEFLIKRGINKEKISYLPHGVDSQLFNPDTCFVNNSLKKISDHTFVIVYTGWVSYNRGLKQILDGTLTLLNNKKDIHLIIAGCDNNQILELENYAKDNRISDNITIMGRLNQIEIPSILKKADVCLSFLEANKSYCLSPPQKIFEYLAMGKPIIANNIPTHTDYITDKFNGLIIDKLDPTLFVKSVIELLENSEFITKMSENALDSSKEYDLDKIIITLFNKIDELT